MPDPFGPRRNLDFSYSFNRVVLFMFYIQNCLRESEFVCSCDKRLLSLVLMAEPSPSELRIFSAATLYAKLAKCSANPF